MLERTPDERGASVVSSVRSVPGEPAYAELLRLHPVVGNAALARLIEANRTGGAQRRAATPTALLQRYTELAKADGGPGWRSESETFVLLENEDSHVYRLIGPRAQLRFCRATGRKKMFGGRLYTEHEPRMEFLRDCLHTAEEIMAQRELELNVTRSQVVGSEGGLFGQTRKLNIANARLVPPEERNAGATPGRGQAYVIVETGKIKEYPYHAAAVIAEDGDDRVTIEVEAEAQHARQDERHERGRFEIYSVTDPDQSFHTQHSPEYTRPITVVIEPRDDED
jgi:hypothetical protein